MLQSLFDFSDHDAHELRTLSWLALFLGFVGVHRFMARSYLSGLAMLGLFAWSMKSGEAAFAAGAVLTLWCLIDVFVLKSEARRAERRQKHSALEAEMLMHQALAQRRRERGE